MNTPESAAVLTRRLTKLLTAKSFQVGKFTLSSGRESPYYVDARRTTMCADGLATIGPLALLRLAEIGWKPDAVGGLTLGADPVAYAVAMASTERKRPIDGFTIRKQPKQHGTAKRIEGLTGEGLNVVVVEDVITTGGSALEAASVMQEAGHRVLGVLAVVDREEGGREAIEKKGLVATSLVTVTELRSALDQQ